MTAFELEAVSLDFDPGTLRFDNQIETEGNGDEPFSDGGDSGSLIVARTGGLSDCSLRAGTRAARMVEASPKPTPSVTAFDELKAELVL